MYECSFKGCKKLAWSDKNRFCNEHDENRFRWKAMKGSKK